MKKILLLSILFISFCGIKAQDVAEDSLRCLEKISEFRIHYEQKNYLDAYAAWQHVVNGCKPEWQWQGVWAHAQVMFDNLIRNEKDSLRKEQYIDTLLWVFDVRHLNMPSKYTAGADLGAKAFNTMRYRSKNYRDAMDWFVQSVDLEKEKTQPYIWETYFKTAAAIVKQAKDTSILINAYEQATEFIELGIIASYKKYESVLPHFANLDSAFAKEQINKIEYDKRFKRLSTDTAAELKRIAMYEKTLVNIEKIFMPYAPCHVLEAVYAKKLEDNRDNLQVLKKMVLTMSRANCITSQVFIDALGIVHKAEPSAQTAYLMGNLSLKNNEVDNAIVYYEEAINLYETNEQKVDPYYMLGLSYLLKMDYSKSREAARNAIRINPRCGKAYMLIGDLYAQSGGRCTGGDLIPHANNWAAADQYNRAANASPELAEEAASKRSKLIFPSGEEIFKRGLTKGNSYFVGCWIQESTTIR